MEFKYTEEYIAAIERAQSYIRTTYANESAAQKFARDIFKATNVLLRQPNLGIDFDTRVGRIMISGQTTRMLVVKKYLVFYTVKSDTIYLLQLVNGTTDYLNQLEYLFKRNDEKMKVISKTVQT